MRPINDQRNRVVELAKKRFLAHGFHRVSLDSLVGELHTSESTVYKYFKTKEDLVKEMIDRLDLEINEDFLFDLQNIHRKCGNTMNSIANTGSTSITVSCSKPGFDVAWSALT
jgi:AcrR family transcriptional regulator